MLKVFVDSRVTSKNPWRATLISNSARLVITLLFLTLLTSAGAQTRDQQTSLTAEQYTRDGNKYAREKEYDKAVDAYRQAIKLNPELADAYHGLGSAFVNMGRAGDALQPMRKAVSLDPNNAIAHLNLGITLASLRLADEALIELNEAKRLSPNYARIHNEIGNVLHNRFGRIDEALAEYREARRLDSNVAGYHHNIGLMLMRLGRFAEAVEPLEQALKLNPDYRNARYLLSDAYSKTRNFDKAVDSWTRFLEIAPNDPDALTKRSWNYFYEGGHAREAATDARKFLDVHGWKQRTSGYLVVMANLGYRGAGMNDEAQAVLEEATKKITNQDWPFNIVRYLNEALSADELLQSATDNDMRTEAHAYIGMNLLLKGNSDEARPHFQWVSEYGNKTYYEYPLAVEELKRLR